MNTAIASLQLLQPSSLTAALKMLRDDGPLTPLAGGTDIYVGLNFGTLKDRRFIDISPIEAMRGVTVRGDVLRVGALTTYRELIESRVVNRLVPMLVAASREIGAVQIQNRGTLGGNVANGSPAGDTLPVLLAADALVELQSCDWVRKVPLRDYYTGYRRSVLRRDELITAIEIPAVHGSQFFRKVGTRAAQSISKVVIAGVHGAEVRIAFGSVAPTVVRVPKTEAALASGASLTEAQEILQTEIVPIDDVRSTAAYRRRVAANLLEDFWRSTGRGRAGFPQK